MRAGARPTLAPPGAILGADLPDAAGTVVVEGPLDLARTVAAGAFGRFDPTVRVWPGGAAVARRHGGAGATLVLRQTSSPTHVGRAAATDAATGPAPAAVQPTDACLSPGAGHATEGGRAPGTGRSTGVGGSAAAVERHEVRVEAWGPGADEALRATPGLVGAGDDPGSFRPDHPVLDRLHRASAGVRFGRSGPPSELVAGVVLGQRVTGGEALRAWGTAVRRWGDRSPGPGAELGLWLPPDPDRLAEVPYPVLHRLGIDRHRAETIRATAAAARRLDALWRRSPEVAVAELQRLPGVGPWTATSLVQQCWGAADVAVLGDLHLPHLVVHAFTGRRRGDDAEMLALLEPYAPHRARVVRLLGRAGMGPPRRVPRARIVSIAER